MTSESVNEHDRVMLFRRLYRRRTGRYYKLYREIPGLLAQEVLVNWPPLTVSKGSVNHTIQITGGTSLR